MIHTSNLKSIDIFNGLIFIFILVLNKNKRKNMKGKRGIFKSKKHTAKTLFACSVTSKKLDYHVKVKYFWSLFSESEIQILYSFITQSE